MSVAVETLCLIIKVGLGSEVSRMIFVSVLKDDILCHVCHIAAYFKYLATNEEAMYARKPLYLNFI